MHRDVPQCNVMWQRTRQTDTIQHDSVDRMTLHWVMHEKKILQSEMKHNKERKCCIGSCNSLNLKPITRWKWNWGVEGTGSSRSQILVIWCIITEPEHAVPWKWVAQSFYTNFKRGTICRRQGLSDIEGLTPSPKTSFYEQLCPVYFSPKPSCLLGEMWGYTLDRLPVQSSMRIRNVQKW